MSNKIFETDSDIEVSEEPIEVQEVPIVEERPKGPKVQTKVLDPEDDNTKVVKTDELGEPKKQRKKRPPLTEERKAQLLKNLEAGRKKALENRQKKAQAKKIIKKKKEEEVDNLIKEDLNIKKYEATEKSKIRDELNEMKAMMKNIMEENKKLKSSPSTPLKTIKEEPVPEPAVAPVAAPVAIPKPKIHRNKGIASRWDKYKK